MTSCNRLSRPAMFLASLALFATTACDHKSAPTTPNYIKGLNTFYLDRSECLLPNGRFPLETTDPAEQKRMNTLVASQLLKVSSEPAIKESRYIPTDLGAKSAPHFCYGYREITSIESATPPAVANGFNETQIVYHYVIKDAPVWAKSEAVQSAFPDLATKMSGNATDKATLAQTRVGWQVPD